VYYIVNSSGCVYLLYFNEHCGIFEHCHKFFKIIDFTVCELFCQMPQSMNQELFVAVICVSKERDSDPTLQHIVTRSRCKKFCSTHSNTPSIMASTNTVVLTINGQTYTSVNPEPYTTLNGEMFFLFLTLCLFCVLPPSF
jgi:hypothetical protein